MGTATLVCGSDRLTEGGADTPLLLYQVHLMGQSCHGSQGFI